MSTSEHLRPLYLVDGYNLLHAVILKGRDRARWWGAEQQRRVVDFVARFSDGDVCVVFDGSAPEPAATPIEVRFAASADDTIVARCAKLEGERTVYVVSADRALIDRARQHGAHRLSPWQFAALCTGSG